MRFPDKPALEVTREHLAGFNGWLCQLKADGWRCLAECNETGGWHFTSCSGEVLKPPVPVASAFFKKVYAAFRGEHPTGLLLDCEMMGKRRKGDPEEIVVIDKLGQSPVSWYEVDAVERWMAARDLFGIYEGPGSPGLVLPAVLTDPCAFFDWHKEHTPWAEGVVCKRRGSVHVGSTKTNYKNRAWIKCKWRAGESGTTPRE